MQHIDTQKPLFEKVVKNRYNAIPILNVKKLLKSQKKSQSFFTPSKPSPKKINTTKTSINCKHFVPILQPDPIDFIDQIPDLDWFDLIDLHYVTTWFIDKFDEKFRGFILPIDKKFCIFVSWFGLQW